jgi:hypothetical protein
MRYALWIRTRPSATRLVLCAGLFGALGCGDGVERGSVQVPERTVVAAGGGQPARATTRPARRAAPDTKVLTPGGRKM